MAIVEGAWTNFQSSLQIALNRTVENNRKNIENYNILDGMDFRRDVCTHMENYYNDKFASYMRNDDKKFNTIDDVAQDLASELNRLFNG